jgi:hypothetical protein
VRKAAGKQAGRQAGVRRPGWPKQAPQSAGPWPQACEASPPPMPHPPRHLSENHGEGRQAGRRAWQPGRQAGTWRQAGFKLQHNENPPGLRPRVLGALSQPGTKLTIWPSVQGCLSNIAVLATECLPAPWHKFRCDGPFCLHASNHLNSVLSFSCRGNAGPGTPLTQGSSRFQRPCRAHRLVLQKSGSRVIEASPAPN